MDASVANLDGRTGDGPEPRASQRIRGEPLGERPYRPGLDLGAAVGDVAMEPRGRQRRDSRGRD